MGAGGATGLGLGQFHHAPSLSPYVKQKAKANSRKPRTFHYPLRPLVATLWMNHFWNIKNTMSTGKVIIDA